MDVLVIKFERGYRLCRKHRVIELWQGDTKVADFATWAAALSYLDDIDPNEKEIFAHARID
jgi:hypothetical protein